MNSLSSLAAAYAENGEFNEAIKCLRNAEKRAPTNYTEIRKAMLNAFQSNKPYRQELKKK
ncbi:hypothetical protein PM8797T_31168 [Gimesia maris DSM 8797]|nr:hypothetical protein PM8797T_31168 [Gimesia maris DSM 8797]